jgi:hypothetical protein
MYCQPLPYFKTAFPFTHVFYSFNDILCALSFLISLYEYIFEVTEIKLLLPLLQLCIKQ